MDEIDKKILQLLMKNSRMPVKEISKQVLLSEPSVKNRMEKLVENGIIENFTIKVNPMKLGFNISFIIKISNLKPTVQSLERILKNFPNLTEAHAITGQENYIVRGYATDINEIDKLLNELMPIGTINTSIIFWND
ncbi:Lrp/AsnC family transcriptional regulator [Listeria sp. PSOL-1]|uniref:Lrp/AsnC family transcriptional regulator n=1 Tax=Listeria sp. PSOL-1 TaxID=1844999 RepID=UPI0013D71E24|nr:Lrp/AsnC family transcriptional regulator [Listeria sp. PSOL-1]